MDPMVSARVPTELRDQVHRQLQKIGSTPTELINSAYEVFLQTKELPKASPSFSAGPRKLSKSQVAKLCTNIEETTFPVPEYYFGEKSYDQLLQEGLKASYEALS